MSNEKPVRITVGDVKEVAEATAIQSEEAQPVRTSSAPVTSASSQGSGNNAIVILAIVISLVLIIIAGTFAMGSKPEPGKPAAGVATNQPADANVSSSTATNVPPAATNTPPAATNEQAEQIAAAEKAAKDKLIGSTTGGGAVGEQAQKTGN